MATLKLIVSDKILDKVIWLLGQFKSEDLQIVESDESFEAKKRYVLHELNRLESGESKSYSIDEVDQILENSIRQYEN
jgi:succinylglutamate desuccinylase